MKTEVEDNHRIAPEVCIVGHLLLEETLWIEYSIRFDGGVCIFLTHILALSCVFFDATLLVYTHTHIIHSRWWSHAVITRSSTSTASGQCRPVHVAVSIGSRKYLCRHVANYILDSNIAPVLAAHGRRNNFSRGASRSGTNAKVDATSLAASGGIGTAVHGIAKIATNGWYRRVIFVLNLLRYHYHKRRAFGVKIFAPWDDQSKRYLMQQLMRRFSSSHRFCAKNHCQYLLRECLSIPVVPTSRIPMEQSPE
jgi:hypothetical protein